MAHWRAALQRPTGAALAHGRRAASAASGRKAHWSQSSEYQEWASLQAFFESSHFRSVQHRHRRSLEELLKQRHGPRLHVAPQEPGPFWAQDERPPRELQPQLDPAKRVDPVDLMYRWARDSTDTEIPPEAMTSLLSDSLHLLSQSAGPLLRLNIPEHGEDPRLIIVGDTHGQLLDVLHIFHTHGPPSESRAYLFNGDVVDRGPQAVEILILVLAFKLRFPQQVHLLRGNHENWEINERPRDLGGGFAAECMQKYGVQTYQAFQRLFSRLPLFAVVGGRVFVVHAGLFRTPDVTLQRLEQLPTWQQHYPMEAGGSWSDDETILFDAQWSDPHPAMGFKASRRGPNVQDFGRDVTARFLESNGLSLCVRSHECPRSGRGFAYTHDRKLLTVFSASNYGGVAGNRGAVAVLRAGPVPGSPSRVAPLDLGGLTVQVVEHDVSATSPTSSSAIFRQANVARRLAGRDPLQAAWGVLLFNRDALLAECEKIDLGGSGYVSEEQFFPLLTGVTQNIDWVELFRGHLQLGQGVAYRHLLRAVRARWTYSTAEQAGRLAEAFMQGEVSLQDTEVLFGCSAKHEPDQEPRCVFSELPRAVKLVLPDITQAQLRDLEPVLGLTAAGREALGPDAASAEAATADDFFARLALFAPLPPELPEEWMLQARDELRALLASTGGCCRAAWELFKAGEAYEAPDANGAVGSGSLAAPSLADALRDTLRAAQRAGLGDVSHFRLGGAEGTVDAARLRLFVEALAAGNTPGRIALFEFLNALGLQRDAVVPPEVRRMAEEYWERRGDPSVPDFIFSYRGALLHGCKFVDAEASGFVPPEMFCEVVKALADVIGRAPSEAQGAQLRSMLGTRPVPYALALSRFEVVVDRCGRAAAPRGPAALCGAA